MAIFMPIVVWVVLWPHDSVKADVQLQNWRTSNFSKSSKMDPTVWHRKWQKWTISVDCLLKRPKTGKKTTFYNSHDPPFRNEACKTKRHRTFGAVRVFLAPETKKLLCFSFDFVLNSSIFPIVVWIGGILVLSDFTSSLYERL